MYYEEKIIDFVLCWRNNPKGEWTEFSKEELTQKLVKAERLLSEMIRRYELD